MSAENSYRNSWVLCCAHKNCNKCCKTLACWKNKANKHANHAQSLKFVLKCVLDDRSETHNNWDDMPKLSVKSGAQTIMKFMSCGICKEKITINGSHDLIMLGCGHTICLTCSNNDVWRTTHTCPFCRKETTKLVRLYYETDPAEEN